MSWSGFIQDINCDVNCDEWQPLPNITIKVYCVNRYNMNIHDLHLLGNKSKVY